MKLENIFAEWEKDSKINREDLGNESLNTASLHHKYHKIYTYERIQLRNYELQLKTLRLDKFEFYTQGPTKETVEKGWKLPPIGKILKADANTYVDADKDVIDLTLKIGIQHEKIDLLSSIIKTLANRGFNINTAVNWLKYTSGG